MYKAAIISKNSNVGRKLLVRYYGMNNNTSTMIQRGGGIINPLSCSRSSTIILRQLNSDQHRFFGSNNQEKLSNIIICNKQSGSITRRYKSNKVLFPFSTLTTTTTTTSLPQQQQLQTIRLYSLSSYLNEKEKDNNNKEETIAGIPVEEKVSNDVIKESIHNNIDKTKYTIEIPVKMPDMGNGDAKIVSWYKKEGDVILYDDILCDIETPEFTYGLETEDEEIGILHKIYHPADDNKIVPPNDIICILLHEDKNNQKDDNNEKTSETTSENIDDKEEEKTIERNETDNKKDKE